MKRKKAHGGKRGDIEAFEGGGGGGSGVSAHRERHEMKERGKEHR